MMSGIRGADTKPEMLIRTGLHALGWRYRLHVKTLPGKPDLVFPRRKAVIFAQGCFWHGHACHLFRLPRTRPDFWREKIAGNINRDLRTRELLLAEHWRVAEVWECQLRGRDRPPLAEVLIRCDAFLRSDQSTLSVGSDKRVQLNTDATAIESET